MKSNNFFETDFAREADWKGIDMSLEKVLNNFQQNCP